MKTNNPFSLILLLLCSICFVSCNNYLLSEKDEEKDDEEEWFESIPDGGLFVEDGRTLRFYYVDRYGNGLIDPNNPDTYPVSWWDMIDYPRDRTNDYNRVSGYYNDSYNRIAYDEEEGMYYCSMLIYGDERQSSYSFPVYAFGNMDMMSISYIYTYNIIGGSRYAHKITAWEYNGTYIYSDDEAYQYEYGKKIFITKYNGQTEISYRR